MRSTNEPSSYPAYYPVKRTLTHELEPGMVVRPRAPDGTKLDSERWTVEEVRGAFTRAKTHGKRFTSQFWATDSLIPVKFKRTRTTADVRSTKSAESKSRPQTGEQDEIAVALKGAVGLDALLDVARSHGFPEDLCDRVREKVSHLNPGLQRMNVGNRLRGWLSKKTGR